MFPLVKLVLLAAALLFVGGCGLERMSRENQPVFPGRCSYRLPHTRSSTRWKPCWRAGSPAGTSVSVRFL
ncbi:MAG: hypothetical protein AB1447_12615 [Bacillota bacterium]